MAVNSISHGFLCNNYYSEIKAKQNVYLYLPNILDIQAQSNSVDTDQTALRGGEPEQGLHCLPFLSASFGGISLL